jgi:hypothetical protein
VYSAKIFKTLNYKAFIGKVADMWTMRPALWRGGREWLPAGVLFFNRSRNRFRLLPVNLRD